MPFPFSFENHAMDVRSAPHYGQDQGILDTRHIPTRGVAPYPTRVIEAGHSPALACAGRMLAALGCDVLFVEMEPEASWLRQTSYARHLRKGKRRITLTEAGALAAGAVILTDTPRGEPLFPAGLPSSSLVVRLTGKPTSDWYVQSGMACLLRGSDPKDEVERSFFYNISEHADGERPRGPVPI